MDDDALCTAEYPGDDLHVGQLCDEPVGHSGNHRCLAEIAFNSNYRRRLVWAPDGSRLPNEETTP